MIQKTCFLLGGGAFPTTGINAALRGFSVTLVDYDGEANKVASELCSFLPEETQRKISFVTANALELRLIQNAYDVVFVAGMVSPKDAVITHLVAQIVREGRETYVLSRTARSPISVHLLNEDLKEWIQSEFHLGTICFNQLCDNRCRVYSASGIAKHASSF
jgi:2-polyprenyl-3-methyl-5-hydroxy-6-metoxy-1,4-benzoquinol methylase